jgi:glucose/arabinose dehydrogenase
MRRLGIALALALAACGGKGKGTQQQETAATPDASPTPQLTMQAIVSFGTEPAADHTKAWLVITDETAAAKSFPLENLPKDAECSAREGGDMKALGTLACGAAGDLIVVARQGEFIILRRPADGDFEEKEHIAIPEGASISFQP